MESHARALTVVACLWLCVVARYNWTAGWVAKPKEYKWTEQPINLGYILDLLNRVHAHEIMVDGAFNGDPHPGNIMLMPDGRVGLIHYGQVKRIPLKARLDIARLVVALARGTKDDVIDCYTKHLNVRTKCVAPHGWLQPRRGGS